MDGGLGRTPKLSPLLGPTGLGQVSQVVLAAECLLVAQRAFCLLSGDGLFWSFLIFTNTEYLNVVVALIKGSEVHRLVAAPGPGSLTGVLVALGGVCMCHEIRGSDSGLWFSLRRYALLRKSKERQALDGLNNLNYFPNVTYDALYKNITVNLTPELALVTEY